VVIGQFRAQGLVVDSCSVATCLWDEFFVPWRVNRHAITEQLFISE
jgi:hypothetical protein